MALKTKDSPLQHLSLENFYNAFLGLDPREKIFVLVGIGVLTLLLLFLPFSLVSGKMRSMQREVAAMEGGYRDVVAKIQEYQAAQREIQEIERKFGGGGSMSGKVEGAAKKAGLAVDQLKERAPQESDFFEVNAVDVKISGATLQQLIDFVHEIENDPASLMRFRRIQIKPRFANRQLLDLNCEIASFQLKREG